MKELLLVAIGSVLVNNIIPSRFLGLCLSLGVSKKVETSAGVETAVISIITIASAVISLIHEHTLSKDGTLGTDLTFLQTTMFILVIVAPIQFIEMFLEKSMSTLYKALGVYLLLTATNRVIFGVALTNVQKEHGFVASVVNGSGAAVGFTIAIIMLAGIREWIKGDDVLYNFQGSPIVSITSGLMTITFFGFSGLI